MIAVVWHYWIGFLLVIGVVLTLLAIGLGYISQVESKKFPKNS
ncbi:MAG: hypothetical protein ACK5PP_10495 [Acidimicrobiales bacterium]